MGNRSTGQPWTPFPPGIEQAFAVQWSSSVVRTNGALELDNRIASPARLPTLLDCGDPSCNRVLKFFIGTNISINHCVSHGSASWPPPLAPPHLERPNDHAETSFPATASNPEIPTHVDRIWRVPLLWHPEPRILHNRVDDAMGRGRTPSPLPVRHSLGVLQVRTAV